MVQVPGPAKPRIMDPMLPIFSFVGCWAIVVSTSGVQVVACPVVERFGRTLQAGASGASLFSEPEDLKLH